MKHYFFLSVLCLAGLSLLPMRSQAQWVQLSMGSTSDYIFAMAGPDTNLFAATNSSGVFRSTNQGITWTAVNSGMTESSVRSLYVSDSNVFAGTIHGGVFLSTNNGTTWVSRNIPWWVDVNALVFSGTTLFAGTGYNDGWVFFSTDSGKNWTAATSGLSNALLYALAVKGTNLFAGGADGAHLSTDGGANWTSINNGLGSTEIRCFAVSGTNLFCGTNGSGVFLTTDDGANWTAVNTGLAGMSVTALAVSPNGAGGTNLFAGLYPGGVYESTNNGSSWAALDTNVLNTYVPSLHASSRYLYAGTTDGAGHYALYRRDVVAPSIVSVRDIPYDQGGKVRIIWNRSSYDALGVSDPVVSYGIWRKVPPGGVASVRPSGLLAKMSISTLTGLYDFIASVPVAHFDQYGYVAPTLTDSTSTGVHRYTYLVSAHTANPSVFYLSEPDSGYSVDNLCPLIPSGPGVSPLTSGFVQLTWSRDRIDPDVDHFAVYRSTADAFPIGDATRLLTTRDTTAIDYTVVVGQTYYYRISCVDIHGNESEPTPTLSTIPLSLELTGFSATVQRLNVVLNWTVASEKECNRYEIERRPGSSHGWEAVGFIAGAGATNSPRRYSFVDHNSSSGKYSYRIKQVNNDGAFRYSQSIELEVGLAPREFQLSQNYPNPFNPTTNIEFTIPQDGRVRVTVYNTLGEEIATLLDQNMEAGVYHRVSFDATHQVSGVYLVRLQFGDKQLVKKMILLK